MSRKPLVITRIIRRPWDKAADTRLIGMHKAGYQPAQMAQEMGRTMQSIYQRCQHLGLEFKPRRKAPPRVKQYDEGPPAPRHEAFDPTNIVARAELLMGNRLTVRLGMRMLDGSPCDLDRLMREANRVLAANGQGQMGRNPNWHVKGQ